MKSNAIIGILLGSAIIFGVFVWEGGTLASIFVLPSMLLVIFGTLAAGVAGSSLDVVAKLPSIIKKAFFPTKYDIEKLIAQIVVFSAVSRRDGILALESRLYQLENPFIQKLFQISIDGADTNTLDKVIESEINHISERHNANISFFNKLGGYSPTMGIIGTVMGLINTMASAGSEPDILIRHIASAFIATLWGIFMANLVWFPIADRLKSLHNEEIQFYQVMIDGVYGVVKGDTPSVVQAALITYYPSQRQTEIMENQLALIKTSISSNANSNTGKN